MKVKGPREEPPVLLRGAYLDSRLQLCGAHLQPSGLVALPFRLATSALQLFVEKLILLDHLRQVVGYSSELSLIRPRCAAKRRLSFGRLCESRLRR